MSTQDELSRVRAAASPVGLVEVGQWFWVKGSEDTWLGCAIHVGSNYVELEGPHRRARIHFDEFWTCCRRELSPDHYIDIQIARHQDRVRALMAEVQEVTARLCIAPREALPDGPQTALVVAGSGPDPKAYQKALIHAKDKELPALFKQIKDANEEAATWMKAKLIPLEAQAAGYRPAIEAIQDRIFAVELYSGLVEKVVRCSKETARPAPLDARVHLMQRRVYMDEECLVNYQAGGMAFKDLRQFDRWLVKKENLERILPHPRTVAAFRIRRHEREEDTPSLRAFIQFLDEREWDKSTFLYIRNGEQLFRLETKLEFDAQLFPDADNDVLFAPEQRLYAEKFAGIREKLITEGEYLERVRAYAEAEAAFEAKHAAWEKLSDAEKKEQPEPWSHSYNGDPSDSWEPFTPESVYYDDISKIVSKAITEHNRIVTILQGLLDRSEVLHPHPPWKLWTPEGFAAAVELVYDDARALVPGPAPDFEAYRARLNASLKTGSTTVGQEDAWELHEGEKEKERRSRDWRHRSSGGYSPKRYHPYGNPGPGTLAVVAEYHARAKTCTFAWMRERQTYKRFSDNTPLRTTFTCPTSVLLNVDAYTPGDFKQFFSDPRTRADYVRWAPLLLRAEEYYTKKAKPAPGRAP